MDAKPRIFVCPLDWGIGHATRCVPVIREFVQQGAEVIIGASNRPLAFLQKEFPELTCIDFPGHEVSYSRKGNSLALHMLGQVPSMLRWTKKENGMLDEFIREHNIQGVISDNRFGLYSQKVPTAFITHQVFIRTNSGFQLFEQLLERLNRNFIDRYAECWIPDIKGPDSLSGELSQKKALPENYHFIGPLSRFEGIEAGKGNPDASFDLVVILSGPEPQRSIFEEKVLQELAGKSLNVAAFLGKPETDHTSDKIGNTTIYSHLPTEALFNVIKQTGMVITRPGYSSIMDLAILGTNALLVPTPGQTEQQYLGRYLMKQGVFACMKQETFNLEEGLNMARQHTGFRRVRDKSLLAERVSTFLAQI